MSQKRFGPTLDAGVVIIEKESEKTITASALGSTAYVGMLERGEVGEVIECGSKRDLIAKTGGYIPDSVLPDCARDFWDHSEGAGALFLLRVTDGTEVKASLELYDRKSPRNKVIKVEAKNGGSWGGKRQTWVVDIDDTAADIAETTIDLPIAFTVLKDQLKGGTLTLTGANGGSGGSYSIIGNDASDGATKTTVNLAADSKADTEYGASVDKECVLYVPSQDVWGQEKHLAVKVKDGEVNPSTEWGLEVWLNGVMVKVWEDLSSDPMSANYFVDLINEDGTNHYITVTDLWVGAVTADMRPANHYGSVASSEITAKKLKIGTALTVVDSSLAGANTIADLTFGTKVLPDVYEVEYVGPDWSVKSLGQQVEHAFPDATDATPYTADNDYSIGFTVTESGPSAGEKFTITVLPLVEDEAIDGRIYLDGVSGAAAAGYLITDNSETEADISSGDLTLGGTLPGTVPYRLEFKQQLGFGYDGLAGLGDTDFTDHYDVSSSKFEELKLKGWGLIKFATPGITAVSGIDATAVEKAGVAYAEARNHQYRFEIPKATTDEFAAKSHVQDTLGKNTYGKVIFPSWATVADPILSGRLKDIPITGMVHGKEAATARNYNGYHKVAAGIEIKLPRVKKIPTGNTVLNGEVLNPAGLQRVDKRGGNYVIWGGRIPYVDPAFKFCQHRELLSHYEHVLSENFDYIVFAINDKQEWPGLLANLKSFFMPEWRKRALRGDTFEDAARLKIDEENNTNLTMAAGDMNADIKLRLADMVERFVISVSKAGIFEDLSA